MRCLRKGQQMLPLKYLFENYDLTKEALTRYAHSERHLDRLLADFRISSNAIYPFRTEDEARICVLRLSPITEKSPREVESELPSASPVSTITRTNLLKNTLNMRFCLHQIFHFMQICRSGSSLKA